MIFVGLLENKLGILAANRISYNSQHYSDVFAGESDRRLIEVSEQEPSLFQLIDVSRRPFICE